MKKNIEIFGAREHNLKNIDVILPQNKLIVFTGISGSGKSSLAFDTIYAEGQRRYMESFSAYARSFIGNMQRPDVDKINGLSPVISIEQKTTSRNPRSTVGTVTEIYDFMRLLFARTAEAFSYVTGEKMVRQSEDQIIDQILSKYTNQKLIILAPVVKGRKGHYRELFEQIRKMGFVKVRVDGQIKDIAPKMQVDRYVMHDIEIVIDRLVLNDSEGTKNEERYRMSQTIHTALQHGKGIIMIMEDENTSTINHQPSTIKYFSKHLMCPTSGISYPEPEPNTFSFNSPYGACPECKGLGKIEEITKRSIIPDESISISRGGIAVLGEYRDIWIFQKLESILKKHKLSISTPIKDIPDDVLNEILYGFSGKEDSSYDDQFNIESLNEQETGKWDGKIPPSGGFRGAFEGILNFLNKQHEIGLEKTKDWLEDFTQTSVCAECKGSRLKKESLHFKINGKNIADLAALDIKHLSDW
ncbi:MAG: excinuclease ABC subunit UvrA, partial [Bacteroidetes bacterium]|nr:excinuclease ABC subunit UvrA [Bacteroidota bacterium]